MEQVSDFLEKVEKHPRFRQRVSTFRQRIAALGTQPSEPLRIELARAAIEFQYELRGAEIRLTRPMHEALNVFSTGAALVQDGLARRLASVFKLGESVQEAATPN
ncbi:MAG: hypothetical protein WC641_03635 [Patescibacteria group bacterium]